MRILITGATGFIGGQLVKALAKQGHDLILTSRRSRAPDVEYDGHIWKVVDFASANRARDWQDIVANVDIVINAVGIFSQNAVQSFEALHDVAPRALFRACERAGVGRIIQISALGADDLATSDYHLSKRRADDALMELSLDAVVLRPSLIIGGEGESWAFFKALAVLPVVPVIGDGRQVLQPIAIEDVVKAVLAALHRNEAVGCRINLVGEVSIGLEAYLHALSLWLGKKRFHSLHIPYGLAGKLAALGALASNLPLNSEAISMLRETRVYERESCRDLLGFTPQGVTGFLAENPASSGERIAARQYFLRPLLRYALAFMWLMAGIVSLFFYPHDQSLQLLAQLGLPGMAGQISLYGAAVVDMAFGVALLANYRIGLLVAFQIGLIALYTLALSFAAPSMWADPFGALAKNVPIIIASLLLASFEQE